MKKAINKIINPIKKILINNPLLAFGSLLVILFGLIVIGNKLRKPEIEEESTLPEPKQVQTYRIGQSPKVTVNAQIEKSGVITIVAQSSGIVQQIYKKEGELVYQGNWIVGLSTTYQGGNTPSLNRQIAQKTYEFNKDNFDLQKDIISKNKQLAEEADNNNDKLSDITNQSIDRTNESINNTKASISLIDDLISYYENNFTLNPIDASNVSNNSTVSSLKAQKISLLSGLNTLEQALRSSEYTIDSDNPPAQISNLTKEVSLKQLELEEKSLELNLETSKLNYQIAAVNEVLMYPSAPFIGKIEKIHVKVGQAVNPGTPLATFSGSQQATTAIAKVPQDIAQNISIYEPSILNLGGKLIEALPIHISSEPTDNKLFSVIYSIPKTNQTNTNLKGYDASSSADLAINSLVEGQYIQVSIPVGYSQTNSILPFIPLDSIYQTQDSTFVYLNVDGVVQSKEIEIGNIYGRFVQVTSGLENQDEIILDRSIITGDQISTI